MRLFSPLLLLVLSAAALASPAWAGTSTWKCGDTTVESNDDSCPDTIRVGPTQSTIAPGEGYKYVTTTTTIYYLAQQNSRESTEPGKGTVVTDGCIYFSKAFNSNLGGSSREVAQLNCTKQQ